MALCQLLGIDQEYANLAYFMKMMFAALKFPVNMLFSEEVKKDIDIVTIELEHQPEMPGIRIGSLWAFRHSDDRAFVFIFLGFDPDGRAWIHGPNGPGNMEGRLFQDVIRESYVELISEGCDGD